MTGFVTAIHASPPDKIKLKPVDDVLDDQPLLTSEMLKLGEWISDYYLCGPGEAFKAMVPAGLFIKQKRIIRPGANKEWRNLDWIKSESRACRIMEIIERDRQLAVESLKSKVGGTALEYTLQKLKNSECISINGEIHDRKSLALYEKMVRLQGPQAPHVKTSPQISDAQLKVINQLQNAGGTQSRRSLLQDTAVSASVLKTLEKKKLVELFERKVERDYYGELRVPPAPELILNSDQERAVETIMAAIKSGVFTPFLLHGITGSGKTQVYIESIRFAIKQGLDAIMLVPEIALTAQTVKRFRAEFQDLVAVIHSKMSNGEKYDAWDKIRRGKSRVVIGPRSAIFAPLKRPGILIVDEEHEATYKQADQAPRYNARDLAVMRAQINGAVVLLGSATPSIESYQNVKRGKYKIIEMHRRIDDISLPEVKIVDMVAEKRITAAKGEIVFSRLLLQRLKDVLEKGEQAMILQNRRGFASTVTCQDCGYVEKCPDCNISLSYHLKGLKMRCHYCEIIKPARTSCPDCDGLEIKFQGIGTQRVEDYLQSLLPEARIARMDFDTTRSKYGHDKLLQAFDDQQFNILLGTQMIAKGLDFSNVTLVGVILADTGLYLPDFRAAEKTFQLLTQVAGRAGRRARQGQVIIQTMSPEHYCIKHAQMHDYQNFFHLEIEDRRELNYPPFGRLALLQLKDKNEKNVREMAEYLAQTLHASKGNFDILGPVPSPLSKIQQHYRFQIMLKSKWELDPSSIGMRKAISWALQACAQKINSSTVKISVNVDPLAVL